MKLRRAGPRSTARAEGDRARDGRDWAVAEERYSAHLAEATDDAAIWVQLGHALKEQGKLPAAEVAYRRAIELKPDDADAHLQLGHALKLQSKRVEAERSYLTSLELAPSKAGFDEVSSIAGRGRATRVLSAVTRPGSADTVYFEIDDILGWLREYKTLSGIQRVQVGIIRNILSDIEGQSEEKYSFIRTRDNDGVYWRIWASDLDDIISYAAGTDVEQRELVRLLDKAEQAAVSVKPARGQCYFVLGAFWGFNGDASRYAKLKRAGVSVGVYIYDLIPITHPEFCDTHLVSAFALSLGDGLAVFDFILTISEFTARDVKRFIEKLDLRKIPVEAVPLAHLLHENLPATSGQEWSENIGMLQGKRFVLSVSTIEARKNHSYLVTAWRLMLDEGLDPPDLVFVGRYGWRVNDLMDQLKATKFLGGRIHVFHDLPDADLECLYRHCQFTVFPSYIEGWGLPVGESLAHGRPCIASNSSSVFEVGGDLVDYVDPYNVRAGVESFRRMSFDDEYRREREKNVQSRFTPRTWREVTTDLQTAIARHRHAEARSNLDPMLFPGELFCPSELQLGQYIPPTYPKRPLRPILAESWYTPEGFGVWMRGSTGALRFQTQLPPETEVVVYLQVAGPPWASLQTVEALIENSDGGVGALPVLQPAVPIAEQFPRQVRTEQRFRRITTGAFVIKVVGRVFADGSIEVRLNLRGSPGARGPEDTRVFSIGLTTLSYAERGDTDLCADIEEYFS